MIAEGIVCPFCPLHCDDVAVADDGSINVECPIAKEQFSRLVGEGSGPRIGDRNVSVEDFIAELMLALESATKVNVVARGCTMQTAQALAGLPKKFRVSSSRTSTESAYTAAIARCGTITATLADIKNQADLIIELGDVSDRTPRLQQKITRSESPAEWMKVEPTADVVAKLMHGLHDSATTSELATKIGGASYVAFVLSSDAFGPKSSGPIVEMLIEYVIGLNKADRETPQRAVIAMLDDAATLKSVHGWHHNRPVASDRSVGATSESTFQIAIGENLMLDGAMGAFDLQIGGTDPGMQHCKMFVPTTQPGIHENDMVIRGDNTITLPLAKWKEPSQPLNSTAEWIVRLYDGPLP